MQLVISNHRLDHLTPPDSVFPGTPGSSLSEVMAHADLLDGHAATLGQLLGPSAVGNVAVVEPLNSGLQRSPARVALMDSLNDPPTQTSQSPSSQFRGAYTPTEKVDLMEYASTRGFKRLPRYLTAGKREYTPTEPAIPRVEVQDRRQAAVLSGYVRRAVGRTRPRYASRHRLATS